MKKKQSILLLLSLFCMILSPFQVAAEGQEVRIMVNGQKIQFAEEPVIVNNTTLVQFRPIFEALGLEVKWEQSTKTITGTKDQFIVKLQIGNNIATVNGNQVKLALAPRIYNGHTFVPLRFIGEATGRAVELQPDRFETVITIKDTYASEVLEKLYSSKLRYEGDKNGNKKNGKGSYFYNDKLWYEGDFLNDEMHGKGKFYNEDGQIVYEGDFKNNIPNGKGRDNIYFNGKIALYRIGSFENGQVHGLATLYEGNGKVSYEGEYERGNISGFGTSYHSDGSKYVGEWYMGLRWGYGVLYDKDGDVYYEGEYYGNQAVESAEDYLADYVFYALEEGDQRLVKKYFSRLLEVHKKDPSVAYLDLAAAYYYLEQYNNVIDTLQTVISYDSKNTIVEAYAMLAVTYALEKQNDLAEEAYKKAVERASDEEKEYLKKIREYIDEIRAQKIQIS